MAFEALTKPDLPALVELHQRLSEVHSHNFDWADWGTRDALILMVTTGLHKESSCNTFGCIAGWASAFFPERMLYSGGPILGNAFGLSIAQTNYLCFKFVGISGEIELELQDKKTEEESKPIELRVVLRRLARLIFDMGGPVLADDLYLAADYKHGKDDEGQTT